MQTGAWGCFDEFNRIPVEVLSVVSAQIKTIQSALADGLRRFTFEGREISLVPTVGIYITMNPGYAGRAELPDNLKALFRPVVMVVPDLAMICENMLMSEGFGKAKGLAKKMTVLYKLAKEQLSKQYHYDFGLRALKSVLVMAGSLKRASPQFDESTILMRALRDMNMPKFVYADVPLFRGLIGDLFPGLDCPRVRYPQFNDAVEASLKEAGMQVLDLQVDKVVQLYETLLTRHTTMSSARPAAARRSAQTLARAQTLSNLPTKLFIINPKAIPVNELYGVLDPVTRDWTDGLLSNIFRDMNKPVPEGKEERRYIVYDGDVDALWVENMNSVMDDNRLLTLPNGERIRLNFPTTSMLFEVFDLQYASPATISRCGMVYVDPQDLGWQPYVERWLANRENEKEAEQLRYLTTKYLEVCIDYVLRGHRGPRHDDRRRAAALRDADDQPRDDPAALQAPRLDADRGARHPDPAVLEATFLLATTWSLGGGLVASGRVQFDKFLKKVSGLTVGNNDTTSAGALPGSLPTLHDFTFDFDQKCWRPGRRRCRRTCRRPTASSRRSWCRRSTRCARRGCSTRSCRSRAPCSSSARAAPRRRPSSPSTGSRNPDAYTSLGINFSSRTSSMDVQIAIEDSIEKRTKDTFARPPASGCSSSSTTSTCRASTRTARSSRSRCSSSSSTRASSTSGGKDLTIKYIKDMQFVAAMVPGRNDVDPRFVRLFNTFCITFRRGVDQAHLPTILQAFFDEGAFPSDMQGADFAGKYRGRDGHLQRDRRRDAAHARQVPLHLQPARPLAHHRGRDAGDARQVRRHGQRRVAAPPRDPAHLLRPPRRRRRQDLRAGHDRGDLQGDLRRRGRDGARQPDLRRLPPLQRDRGGQGAGAAATWCASTRTWPTTARSSSSSTRCSPRTTWRTR